MSGSYGGDIPYLMTRRVVAPHKGQEPKTQAAGASPRPTGPSHPGGVNYNENAKGYDAVSDSGARGTAGRCEGAAGRQRA